MVFGIPSSCQCMPVCYGPLYQAAAAKPVHTLYHTALPPLHCFVALSCTPPDAVFITHHESLPFITHCRCLRWLHLLPKSWRPVTSPWPCCQTQKPALQ